MKKIFVFISILIFIMIAQPIFSQTSDLLMNVQLKVLDDNSMPLVGFKTVTVNVRTVSGNILWEESHNNVLFVSGIAGFKVGTVVSLHTLDLYDEGNYLTFEIDGSQATIEMASVPFSMFTYASDVVNTIKNEGLFYIDHTNERIGISTPNPTVKLDVNGGIRIGDTTIQEPGAIRFHDNSLQGWLGAYWLGLDFEIDPEYQSKWTTNSQNTYIPNNKVGIGIVNPNYELDVTGTGRFTNQVFAKTIHINSGKTEIGQDYEISDAGIIKAVKIELEPTNNYWDETTLRISGILTGDGSALTNIGTNNLATGSVTQATIANYSLTSSLITPNAVDGRVLGDGAITQGKFIPGLVFSGDYVVTNGVTGADIKDGAIVSADLSPGFLLHSETVVDAAVVSASIVDQAVISAKIATGAVTAIKIANSAITTTKLAAMAIQEIAILPANIENSHFATASVTIEKIQGIIPVSKGGTGKASYSIGSVIFANSSTLSEDNQNFFWDESNKRLGIGINSPEEIVHINANTSEESFILIEHASEYTSSLAMKNVSGNWELAVDNAQKFYLRDKTASKNRFTIDILTKLAIGEINATESVALSGALVLGNTLTTSPNIGVLRFSGSALQGNLGPSWKDLGDSGQWAGISYGDTNSVTYNFGVILGGNNNNDQARYGTIIGGSDNNLLANSSYSTIGGGYLNSTWSGFGDKYSVIIGGDTNIIDLPDSNDSESLVIGGGSSHSISSQFSFIMGGFAHSILSSSSGIWGGNFNWLAQNGQYLTILSGQFNSIDAVSYSTIVGGKNVFIINDKKVKGGNNQQIVSVNQLLPNYAFHGVGRKNAILSPFGIISGGKNNTVKGMRSVISGGKSNEVKGALSIISGGSSNKALGSKTIISGGSKNQAFDLGIAITGGKKNIGRGKLSYIGGGKNNKAKALNSVINGGHNNVIKGNYASIGSGSKNKALCQGSVIKGGKKNKAVGSFSYVGSGRKNKAEGDISLINGGMRNKASEYGAVIAGGKFNKANKVFSSIGGGIRNKALGSGSVIAGGENNEAKGDYSTIIGGKDNKALGQASVSLGGQQNEAIGAGSIAAGTKAKAKHEGTFIFSDRSSKKEFTTTGKNKFMVRAQGGVEFYTDSVGDEASSLIGAVLDGGSWAHTSDRNKKTNFQNENPEEILAKLVTIPIQSWQYKKSVREGLAPSQKLRHIGSVSQDFYGIFGYGKDDKHISAVDADGIALSSIQGLYLKNKAADSVQVKVVKKLSAMIEIIALNLDKVNLGKFEKLESKKDLEYLDNALIKIQKSEKKQSLKINKINNGLFKLKKKIKKIEEKIKSIESKGAKS